MLVGWLDQPQCQDVTISGGKGAALSRLSSRFPVPVGFCVTAEAYRQWVAEGQSDALPDHLHQQVGDAYQELERRTQDPGVRVAVRSSAVSEDGPAHSFAGLFRTCLALRGAQAVSRAVVECWRSADGEEVRSYQQRAGGGGPEAVAVVVQQLVLADVSFVAFSADPLSGDRARVLVNANWGLGESIVSGAVVPDSYLLCKLDGAVVQERLADKAVMTIVRDGEVITARVPRALRRRRTLSALQAREVAALAARLEEEMACPVDLEGVFRHGQLSLVQCRPITNL